MAGLFTTYIYAHTCIFYMKLIMPFKKRAVSSEVFPSIFKNKINGYPILEISNNFRKTLISLTFTLT